MKVRVTVTVDIDPDAWTLNYGVEGTEAIHKDVETYCAQALHTHLEQAGVMP